MRAALPSDDLDMAVSLTSQFLSRFHGARLVMTGGSGFIGAWLLQVLQRANDTVGSQIDLVVLSRDPERVLRNEPHVFGRSDITLIAGDVNSFSRSIGKFDLCIHAAADVGDPHRAAQPLKVFDTLVQGTRRMLDLAQAAGASRFLLTSSGAVYGPQPTSLNRIPESYQGATALLKTEAAYGNGKRAAEWLTCAYAQQAGHVGLETCIARIFALIGPGLPLDGPFAAGNFIRDALAGNGINIHGDGRPLRSYLYMSDLCVWLLRILGEGASMQAYNVGSESAVSIAELAGKVQDATGVQVPIHIHAPASPDDANTQAPRYVPDTRRARHELGLAEYTSLDSALQKTIQWSRSTNRP